MSDSDDSSLVFYDAYERPWIDRDNFSLVSEEKSFAPESEVDVGGDEEEKNDDVFHEIDDKFHDDHKPMERRNSAMRFSALSSSIQSLFGGASQSEFAGDSTSSSDSEMSDEDRVEGIERTKQAMGVAPSNRKKTLKLEKGKASSRKKRKESKSWISKMWDFFSGNSGNSDSHGNATRHGGSGKHGVAPPKKSGVKVTLMGIKRSPYHNVKVIQNLEIHHGPVWVMRFSRDGKFLASGGQDGKAVVWSIGCDRRDTCLVDIDEDEGDERYAAASTFALATPNPVTGSGRLHTTEEYFIYPVPCRVYSDHDGHIVDLSWSSMHFLITACLDKVVRLWHVKSSSCLQKFKHNDLVSSIDFHPTDDRYFVTGCFDKVLRLWDTTNSEPVRLKEAQDMITSIQFTPDGMRVAVGLFRGQVFFYKTEDLKIETQIVCTKSSAKRKLKYGYKVTGLVFRTMYENKYSSIESESYELLVTTNDSNIRLYQVKDLSLTTKFKGNVNKSRPIRASFSNDGRQIICGSDNTGIFIWKNAKRLHMERNAARNKEEDIDASAKANDVASESAEEEVNEKEEERFRKRLETLYYSKKYNVYKKCLKLVCDDNFKHLSTTVAIFASSSALKEGSAHMNRHGQRNAEESIILGAEINGSIRIIRAKHYK